MLAAPTRKMLSRERLSLSGAFWRQKAVDSTSSRFNLARKFNSITSVNVTPLNGTVTGAKQLRNMSSRVRVRSCLIGCRSIASFGAKICVHACKHVVRITRAAVVVKQRPSLAPKTVHRSSVNSLSNVLRNGLVPFHSFGAERHVPRTPKRVQSIGRDVFA